MTYRIKRLHQLCKERGLNAMPTHFLADLHGAALGQFAALPHMEKLARSMAYAIENQPVFAYEEDRLGGRVYYIKEAPVAEYCGELDCDTSALEEFKKECPEAEALQAAGIFTGCSKGHISWRYDRILELGVEGFKKQVEAHLSNPKDEQAKAFYEGVLILLDALLTFNDKHIAEYERLGNFELADRMRRVPRTPCESFRDAVQAYFMQHIVVMRENPHGGNSPGRLDHFLWPYLKKDLEQGVCT